MTTSMTTSATQATQTIQDYFVDFQQYKQENKVSQTDFKDTFIELSKKALFITSVPFYWFIFFTVILNWFSLGLFLFVVGASYTTSFIGHSWGILTWFVR